MDSPYTWRAWTRDGITIMRGDIFRGKPVLSPMGLLRDQPDCLRALTLMPEMPGWPVAEVTLEPHQRLEYHIVRENSISEGGKGATQKEVVRCVILGLIDRNTGIKTHLFLHPGFSTQIMTGNFEALLAYKIWQAKVAKAHGLLAVEEMPKILPASSGKILTKE